MNAISQHWFKAGILLVLIAIVGLISYYFMEFLPNRELQQEAAQQLQAAEQKSEQSILLQSCLSSAQASYTGRWGANCLTSGISDKGPSCTLPMVLANSINQTLQEDKDNCFKEYPQN